MTSTFTKCLVFFLFFLVLEPCLAQVDLMGLRFQHLPGDFSRCGETGLIAATDQAAAPAQAGYSLHDLTAKQHYCLGARFLMPEKPGQNQVLSLSLLAATELFLDSVKVGRNGKPAITANEEVPGYIEYSVSLTPEQLQQGAHSLVLKISRYHGSERVMNPFYDLSITEHQGLHAADNRGIILPLLLTGALLLVVLLFSGLTLFYQRHTHWILFLTLSLVASSLLMVESWRALVGYLYPFHLTRLYLVAGLTYLFSILLPLYFLVYFRFERLALIASSLAVLTAAVTFISPYFDSKSALMFGVALLASLLINFIAYKRQKKSSGMSLLVVIFSLVLFLTPAFHFAETGFALSLCFLLFTLLLQLLQQFARDKQKAALATQLENQLLRRSLQPHFLMNSLSLVSELLHQSPQQAEEFIQALGREFRMLNEYANHTSIALTQELELCQNYLEIMSTRLQKKCHLQIQGDPSAIIIPPAILLTVLENAFSHNKYRQETRFELHIHRDQKTIEIVMKIPVVSPKAHAGTGMGNHYIHQSLQEVFDGRASYVTEQLGDVWHARFQLPLISAQEIDQKQNEESP
ncbi:sensor histidine kinase [Undibacterium sp. Ji83W]|uniref:sensor histidine kinase n=1 Tax=Undibacterium sp. Ji83W TaxID=3413043 RepID=UPI003BF1CF08